VIIGSGQNLGTNGEQPVLDDTTIYLDISKYLTGAAITYFGPENWGENGETLQKLTGIMGYTPDRQPIIGEAPGQRDFGSLLDLMGTVHGCSHSEPPQC